jgi:hypothetical protein
MKNTKLSPTQLRLVLFAIFNFYYGMILMVIPSSLEQCVKGGLWHKIIPFMGINIPIGVISMIFLSCFIAFATVVIVKLDYCVLKYGLEWIKVKEDKEKAVEPIEC